MIQTRLCSSIQSLQNHSSTPAGPIYLHAATNLCPPQKCLPRELQQHNTPTSDFLDTRKCNLSKNACSNKGHATFATLNMLVNLADLTDLITIYCKNQSTVPQLTVLQASHCQLFWIDMVMTIINLVQLCLSWLLDYRSGTGGFSVPSA